MFKRNAAQPSTPAASGGVPPGWYSDVASVPVSSDILWSSVGSRAWAADPWVWDVPVQVEGSEGPQGADGANATLFYIKPLDGTAIKNGLGTLRLEAHRIIAGVDAVLSAGPIQLYEGGTAKGYTASFTSAQITGSAIIELKDNLGATYDSISLVDVIDGTVGGPGHNAVYGYVEADGPLAWVRLVDQATWSPTTTTMDLDCTFVQGGVDVARVSRRISMASNGMLTAAATAHAAGDLNGSRVTVTVLGSGTQVLTVKFGYSYVGDEAVVTETALTSITPAVGAPGPGGISLQLSRVQYNLMAYQNGTLVTPFNATGLARTFEGTTEVTGTTTFSVTGTNCTVRDQYRDRRARGRAAARLLPPDGPRRGHRHVHDQRDLRQRDAEGIGRRDEEIRRLRNRRRRCHRPTCSKVASCSLPGHPWTGDNKLYRYNGTNWTVWVDGADIRRQLDHDQPDRAGRSRRHKIYTSRDCPRSRPTWANITAGTMTQPDRQHPLQPERGADRIRQCAGQHRRPHTRARGGLWSKRCLPRLVRAEAGRADDRRRNPRRDRRRLRPVLFEDRWHAVQPTLKGGI